LRRRHDRLSSLLNISKSGSPILHPDSSLLPREGRLAREVEDRQMKSCFQRWPATAALEIPL
jgi:hypothetical protein